MDFIFINDATIRVFAVRDGPSSNNLIFFNAGTDGRVAVRDDGSRKSDLNFINDATDPRFGGSRWLAQE